MSMKIATALVFAFSAGPAGTVAAQQATPTPTPAAAEQHVVAPSLPDQPNKEGVARPGGSMPTDSEGYVRSNRGAIDPSTTSPSPASASPSPVPSPPSPALASEASTSSPRIVGPAAAGRAHAKGRVLSGGPSSTARRAPSTVTAFEKGKSLTVKTPAGTLVTYRLAKGAVLPDDLSAGRTVLVETRIVKKRRYATKVSYAEAGVTITNVN